MAQESTFKPLLVDEQFCARLDTQGGVADDMATVLLERVSIAGEREGVGSVHLQADQTWLAAIRSARDEFVVLAMVFDRRDAIVALWQHRHEAFLGHCAL